MSAAIASKIAILVRRVVEIVLMISKAPICQLLLLDQTLHLNAFLARSTCSQHPRPIEGLLSLSIRMDNHSGLESPPFLYMHKCNVGLLERLHC